MHVPDDFNQILFHKAYNTLFIITQIYMSLRFHHMLCP